jgi:hypothetical protein
MRTAKEKYLGGLEIAEDQYKVDLAVTNLYQSFSGELLRLSLLGIAGYGFLITDIALKVSNGTKGYSLLNAQETRVVLVLGVLALGISAATALGHRYFSADCIAHYIRWIRLKKQSAQTDVSEEEKAYFEKLSKVEQKSLAKDLSTCARLLVISSSALVIGAFAVALAFVFTLLRLPTS